MSGHSALCWAALLAALPLVVGQGCPSSQTTDPPGQSTGTIGTEGGEDATDNGGPPGSNDGLPSVSDKSRNLAPNVDPGDLLELAWRNGEFAFDVYQSLRGREGNLFYSPYSISLALAMAHAGARNGTEQQMANVLHFTLPQDRLHPAMNKLDLALASRGQGAAGSDGGEFRLHIANSIWVQMGYSFLPEYLDLLAVNYGEGLHVVDFQADPEGARLSINAWAGERTEGRIPDLIPPGAINTASGRSAGILLANAVYFNAAWQKRFDKSRTVSDVFHRLDGVSVTTPMMSQATYYKYARVNNYQCVEMPYDGDQLSMVLIVPDLGAFESAEPALRASQFETILVQLTPTYVHLTLPKFTYGSQFLLAGPLAELGMVDAFAPPPDGAADFTGIAKVRELFISDVIHRTFLSVDEDGTEATAATAVVTPGRRSGRGGHSAPPPAVEFKIDRPFIFVIRDLPTRTILFVGRILNPAG